MLLDLRLAARTFWRAPGHTVPIVVLLAAGIAANAAMFTLYNALFIRDLPVADAERLAIVSPFWSVPNFEELRRNQKSFIGMMASGSALGAVVRNEAGE